jgi:hypothetical protein
LGSTSKESEALDSLEKSGLEKRLNERFGLELPVVAKWQGKSGETRLAWGKTKDISHSGAFIVCDSAIGEGCPVDIRIDLPISLLGLMESRISVSATVVRNAPEPEPAIGYGHGILFDYFHFRRI